ncbi:inositol monophosphatase [Haloarcula sp. S1CR25-12]|uniref:fructose-bisphosphatase n=1 Tax=Haloarcula saliterrae TaxID=2950534 RepID=A0ABU2F9L8_9EURY|nr:inositol monophosphatase [Haloarcula sp. S1CR25-12]MDS0258877.1 inositol monophosphatase [Haloarcula sp. S1CR25-12]
MPDAHHRAAVAERAARAGGVVARQQFRGDVAVETKTSKNDFVTETDRDAQAQVVATVREEFPGDRFLCEEELVTRSGPETAETPPTGVDSVPETGAAWVVDPIDGTTNFVRGLRTWATSVAALSDGETVGAATYMPSMGDLYAVGPESATRDGATLSVSERTDPETFVVTPVGWWEMDDRAEFGRLCTAVAERFGDMRRIGSFQATLAFIADGALDGAVCPTRTNPWDTLAGVYMVRQAGGTVTDLEGERWRHDSVGLVASNGQAHDELVAAANAALD